MLAIQKKLTPYNFTAMRDKKNQYIVVHYVGSVSTAKNNADYFSSQKLNASANYFVDETSIWQSVEDSDKAWHCGGGLQGASGHAYHNICTNSNSIGIEMCVKKTASGIWYFEEETISNTVDLICYLMNKHSLPLESVLRHYDVTGKLCPAPLIDEKTWADFQNKIKKEASAMNNQYSEETIPSWAAPTVQKLIDLGVLHGTGEGELNLSFDMLRILVILDRAGVYDR